MKSVKIMTFGLCATLVLSGCATKQGTYAAGGAGGGALIGGILGNIIGKDSKATAIGAAIGAAVGSGAGALIGHHMDKVAAEMQEQVKNAQVETVTDANGLTCVKATFDSGLMFATNSYSLSAASKRDLENFASVLKNNTNCDVDIYGHTDATGNDQINLPLSTNRAQSVANYLIANGVSPRQLSKIEGKGSSQPVENAVKSQKNRRVEIYLYASKEMIQQANAGTLSD